MSVRPGSLHLNRANGRFLGVCAGIADWLDVPAVVVRVVFVICVLSWPTLIVGYFLLYLCLDKDLTPDRMKDYFRSAKTAEHFRQLNYRKPIYKNTRNKRIAGVCSGIADYLEVSAFSVRLVTLLSLFVFGPFTFWAYLICMFVFDPDPYAEPSDRSARRSARRQARHARRQAKREARGHGSKNTSGDDFTIYAEFETDDDFADREADAAYEETTGSRQAGDYSKTETCTPSQATKIFSELEMRLRDIEAYMTSKRFRLHCEINRI